MENNWTQITESSKTELSNCSWDLFEICNLDNPQRPSSSFKKMSIYKNPTFVGFCIFLALVNQAISTLFLYCPLFCYKNVDVLERQEYSVESRSVIETFLFRTGNIV